MAEFLIEDMVVERFRFGGMCWGCPVGVVVALLVSMRAESQRL
jgi:hypothetical protein